MITDDQLRQIVARELNVPPDMLQPGTVLASLPDFDSVELVMMIVALEEAGVKISAADAANLPTFEHIRLLPRR